MRRPMEIHGVDISQPNLILKEELGN